MPEIDLINNFNVEREAMVFLLMMPVVATVAGIARHIIGIKSLGLYAPIVLTFSLYALGLNDRYGEYSDIWAGVRYGLIFTTVVIGTTILGTSLLKSSHMHYFPKISINLSLVSAALIATLIFADLLGREGFTSTSGLALIMIASVSEQFTASMFKSKLRVALVTTFETMLTAFFGYFLISWPKFQDLILSYPYMIILVLLINYLVGKYRGLRIFEFFRFRKILNNISEAD